MAISGTFSAADASTKNAGDVGIDLGASGTFVASETWTTSIAISGGEVATSKESSLGGVSVQTTGDKSSYVLTIVAFYDNGTGGVFENVWDAYEAGTSDYDCEIQWSKDRGTTGNNLFTTSGGKITSCTPPDYDAANSEVQKFSFVITAPTIARTEAS